MSGIGLYLHVPFCAKKCAYCDFPSYAGAMHLRGPYLERLLGEMGERSAQLGRPAVNSVFIGGGTPSLLQPGQMSRLLRAMHRHFDILPDAEISCEANPGMLSAAFLEALRGGGVNRLSLGAQSADPALLALLGRQHSWRQVEEAVALARDKGFCNLNIDLMLGIPRQTPDVWADTLEKALALSPEHLSCYGMILEEDTPFQEMVASGELQLPRDEDERAMYDHCLSRLGEAGYNQYEISNFARPGFPCRHNLHTWERLDYLGLGSAAHSLLDNVRYANPPLLDDYLAGRAPQIQRIAPPERMFESVMLGLRLTRGVDLEAFEKAHGRPLDALWPEAIRRQTQDGLAELGDGHYRLSRRGMDVMNTLLLDFMEAPALS